MDKKCGQSKNQLVSAVAKKTGVTKQWSCRTSKEWLQFFLEMYNRVLHYMYLQFFDNGNINRIAFLWWRKILVFVNLV